MLSTVAPGYLCWYLNQPQVRHHFRQLTGQGVLMPVVRRKVLEQLRIPLPPLRMQKAIDQVSRCIKEEARLVERLAAKRRELADALCRQALELYV